MTTRVAVYGTLKKGLSNHHYMSKARFLSEDQLHNLVLYDLGPYPGARLEASGGVVVEIYEVDSKTFAQLDVLEGIDERNSTQGLYHRRQLATSQGLAWVYLYNHSTAGCPAIREGGWPIRVKPVV
jgi:gamma-glutamylcyclotransferase (GGCT)/AIG2-like uncharacterized protein YtfP